MGNRSVVFKIPVQKPAVEKGGDLEETGGITPPPHPPPPPTTTAPPYIPANPWPTTFKDDVTVILLLGASFMKTIQRRFDKNQGKMVEGCICIYVHSGFSVV
jgi:hypothetical protein